MSFPAKDLAQRFHELYERLAPAYGYETRAGTRTFDASSPNGRLMVAVCGEILAELLKDHRNMDFDSFVKKYGASNPIDALKRHNAANVEGGT